MRQHGTARLVDSLAYISCGFIFFGQELPVVYARSVINMSDHLSFLVALAACVGAFIARQLIGTPLLTVLLTASP